jgi:hypothetical protein
MRITSQLSPFLRRQSPYFPSFKTKIKIKICVGHFSETLRKYVRIINVATFGRSKVQTSFRHTPRKYHHSKTSARLNTVLNYHQLAIHHLSNINNSPHQTGNKSDEEAVRARLHRARSAMNKTLICKTVK